MQLFTAYRKDQHNHIPQTSFLLLSTFLSLITVSSFFLRSQCLENLLLPARALFKKMNFPLSVEKKICFFNVSVFAAFPPPSSAFASPAFIPFYSHPPIVSPLENRGHCTNDYSDPSRHGNACCVTAAGMHQAQQRRPISKLSEQALPLCGSVSPTFVPSSMFFWVSPANWG